MLGLIILSLSIWLGCGFVYHGLNFAAIKASTRFNQFRCNGRITEARLKEWYKQDLTNSILMGIFVGPIALLCCFFFEDYKYGFELW